MIKFVTQISKKDNRKNIRNLLTKKFLKQEYCIKKKNQQEIADNVGCSRITIRNYLIKYKIKIRTLRESHKQRRKIQKILTPKFLKQEYLINKKTMREIAQQNNYSQSVIRTYLIEYSIKIRTGKENFSGYKNPNFKGKIKLTCPICNKIFDIFPSQNKIHKNHFCSLYCRSQFFALSHRGKNNYNYIDGRKSLTETLRTFHYYKYWRKQVFVRDNYTCQE